MEGWFKLHRSVLSMDDVFWKEKRPRTKWEAWVDLINQAAFKDHDTLYREKVVFVPRGEFPTSERELMARWRWSRGEVRRFLKLLVKMERIEWKTGRSRSDQKTVQQTDHGLTFLSICNYERYQSTGEPGGTTNGTSDGPNRRRERKKIPPEEEIAAKRNHYSPAQLSIIDLALDAFRSTRKTGRMADSVILAEFTYWERFTPTEVEAALRTYVEKDYARQGKNEKYARGILRNPGPDRPRPLQPNPAHPYQRLP